MTETSEPGPFTARDFEQLSELVVDAWGSGVGLDWSVLARTLGWTCFRTADHTVDCIFSYALLLASRRQGSYPPFTELHALPGRRAAAASLDVDVENTGAKRLYLRLGYEIAGPREYHWRSVDPDTEAVVAEGVSDTWLMRKSLC